MALNITNPLHKLGENKSITKLGNLAIEARRLELLNRRLSTPDDIKTSSEEPIQAKRERLSSRREGLLVESGELNLLHHTVTEPIKDSIRIIDLDYNGPNEGIRTITLPFVPRELGVNPDSNFVTIKPMGANNPKYHFTGSEDQISLEIEWHSLDINRDDVIKNCRLIEALSKADGYDNPPHRVMLMWGDENVLFRDMIFLVIAAPYTLTNFNKAQFRNNKIQTTAMLPKQALQKVTLARITSYNLLTKDIQQVSSNKYY